MKSAKEFSRFARLMPGLLALLLLAANVALAQVDAGTILGTIKDQTGAVIPGAKVTLANEGTGLSLSTVTNSDGSYTFTPIKIGTYTVSASFRGFQKSTHVHVIVNVQQQVVVNFTLHPGAVTQTVIVTTAPPLLETQNASVGQVVTARTINDLPLNGRNFTFLAQLAAGVTFGQQDTRGESSNGRFVANGVGPTQNDYLLDGIDNNSALISYQNGKDSVTLPPVDALSEFKVQTSNYSAEFGHSAGAVLNATIKSGTNQLHGDAWEFLRNNALDSADFFLNAAQKPIGAYRRTQFGFTLGGPVEIPHIYHGKNKTFFFVDYQGTRIQQPNPFSSTVPTLLERESGFTDFADLISGQKGSRTDILGRTSPLGTIFDPATTRPVTQGQLDPVTGIVAPESGFVRDPFPGNILPASRIDANAAKLLMVLPPPNQPGVFSNYTSDPTFTEGVNSFDVRVDHNFSSRDQMFARYSFVQDDRVRPGPYPGIADGSTSTGDSSLDDRSQNAVVSWTHTISPTMINEARLGLNREHALWLQPFANDLSNIPLQFGIQGVAQSVQNGGLPRFDVGDINHFGSWGYIPSNKFGTIPQATDNVTKIIGPNTLKFGFEYQHVNFPFAQPPQSRGFFSYSGQYTSVVNATDASTGIAQLLLIPEATTVPDGIDNDGGANSVSLSNFHGHDLSRNYLGLYGQDDWKATRRLTLNLGLRWEYYGLPQENFGAQANFLPGAPFNGATFIVPNAQKSIFPQTMIGKLAKDGISFKSTNNLALGTVPLTDFGPRIGLAYQATSRLVVRAGYGMFYGQDYSEIGGSPLLTENFPFEFTQTFVPSNSLLPITPDNSIGLIENSFPDISFNPNQVNISGLSLIGIQYHYITPSVEDYNLTLQYQLTPNTSFQAGYVGTASRHALTGTGANSVSEILPPNTTVQQHVPFPDFARGSNYTTTDGATNYNSLQVTVQRRFHAGLDFLGDYTWSKCRTDARDQLEGDIGGYRAPNLPGFGIQGDYAFCDFYVPHVIHFSGIYQLPVGSGRHFLRSTSGLLNQLVGGWQMNWILTLQDGNPFTVPCTVTTAAGMGCNALLVPGQNPIAGSHDVNQWMNPAAFADPPVATAIGQTDFAPLGGAPTQLLGPGFHRLDFSLFKEFRTSETTHLEFRTEVFNLTNTPNFAFPTFLNFANPATFGKITATRDNPDDPREIQFALKFYW